MPRRKKDPTIAAASRDLAPIGRDLNLSSSRARRHRIRVNVDKALDIIEAVAQGSSLNRALKRDGMPSQATFYHWLTLYPELAEAYEAAKTLSAQALEDKALEVAERLVDPDADEPSNPRLRGYDLAMAQWRWSAERRDRQRFAPRGPSEGVIVPIQINTTLGLGEGAALPQAEASIYQLTGTTDPSRRGIIYEEEEEGESETSPQPPIEAEAAPSPRPRAVTLDKIEPSASNSPTVLDRNALRSALEGAKRKVYSNPIVKEAREKQDFRPGRHKSPERVAAEAKARETRARNKALREKNGTS